MWNALANCIIIEINPIKQYQLILFADGFEVFCIVYDTIIQHTRASNMNFHTSLKLVHTSRVATLN